MRSRRQFARPIQPQSRAAEGGAFARGGAERHIWGGSAAPRRHSRATELPDGRRPGHGRGRDSSRRSDVRVARGPSTVSGPHEDAGARTWPSGLAGPAGRPARPFRATPPTRHIAPPSVSLPRFAPSAALRQWRASCVQRPATRGLPDPVNLALSVHLPSCDGCAGYGRRVRSQSSIGAPCRSGPRLT